MKLLGPIDWAEPVTARRPEVTGATALVLALLVWRVGLHPDLPAFLYLGLVGVPLAFVDVALRRLPDHLTLVSYPVGLVLLGLAAPFTRDGGTRYVHALVGLAALGAFFGVQWLAMPRQIGLGDVKLAGVLGLYLAWLGYRELIFGTFAMFAMGLLIALAMLATRRTTLRGSMPFGPAMLLGALTVILAG